MYIPPYDKHAECNIRGLKFEPVARALFESYGYETRPALKHEGIYQHIDFWAKGKDGEWHGVDAKAMKRLNRSDADTQAEWTFIEWKNQYGLDGWLVKGAEIMCFEVEGGALVCQREKLLEWARWVVDMDKAVTSSRDCKYCVYTRKDRMDLMSLVRFSDMPKGLMKFFPTKG
jgi:hypothetical protein